MRADTVDASHDDTGRFPMVDLGNAAMLLKLALHCELQILVPHNYKLKRFHALDHFLGHCQ
jgi:hypothetical protein